MGSSSLSQSNVFPHKEGVAVVEAVAVVEDLVVRRPRLEVVTSIKEASGGLPLKPVKFAGIRASHMRTVTNTGERTSAGGTPATIWCFANLP